MMSDVISFALKPGYAPARSHDAFRALLSSVQNRKQSFTPGREKSATFVIAYSDWFCNEMTSVPFLRDCSRNAEHNEHIFSHLSPVRVVHASHCRINCFLLNAAHIVPPHLPGVEFASTLSSHSCTEILNDVGFAGPTPTTSEKRCVPAGTLGKKAVLNANLSPASANDAVDAFDGVRNCVAVAIDFCDSPVCDPRK